MEAHVSENATDVPHIEHVTRSSMNKRQKMLTREEVDRLVPLAQAGNDRAKARLLQAYIPMVRAVCRLHRNSWMNWDELEQIATLGFMAALRRYNPERGAFSTLLKLDIKNSLRTAHMSGPGVVSMPKCRHTQKAYIEGSLSDEQMAQIDRAASGASDIDDIDQSTFVDDSDPSENLDRTAFRRMVAASIHAVLQDATPRERDIVLTRMTQERSSRTLSTRYGVSDQRIRQIERAVLERVRRHMVDNVPAEHLEEAIEAVKRR